jgi:hypothetical protein
MPCWALVEPSEGCEIDTVGDDEDELPEEVGELDVGAGVGAGADGCETGADGAGALGVTDATAGVGEEDEAV